MSAPRIRIIRHEAVPKSGSFEVCFPDGRESRFCIFDNVPAAACAGGCSRASRRGAGQGVCKGERDKGT